MIFDPWDESSLILKSPSLLLIMQLTDKVWKILLLPRLENKLKLRGLGFFLAGSTNGGWMKLVQASPTSPAGTAGALSQKGGT